MIQYFGYTIKKCFFSLYVNVKYISFVNITIPDSSSVRSLRCLRCVHSIGQRLYNKNPRESQKKAKSKKACYSVSQTQKLIEERTYKFASKECMRHHRPGIERHLRRGKNMILSLPFGTSLLLIMNILVHILIFLSTANLSHFSIAAAPVIFFHEYYRIVSSAFVHGGAFHILMNMMSLAQLGPALEIQFGTLQMLISSFWIVLIEGFLYVTINYILGTYILNDRSWLMMAGVGYSGVLFSYAIMDSYHTSVQSRSVFGFFNVPAKVYPWILLVLISLFLPNISFMGHLCGILAGILVVNGWLIWLLPLPEYLQSLETSSILQSIITRDTLTYIRCPDKDLICSGEEAGLTGVFSIFYQLILFISFGMEAVLAILGFRLDLSGTLQRNCSNQSICSNISSCLTSIASHISSFVSTVTNIGLNMTGNGNNNNSSSNSYRPPWERGQGSEERPAYHTLATNEAQANNNDGYSLNNNDGNSNSNPNSTNGSADIEMADTIEK